ncbi:MAG: hypothetical protein AAF492_27460 [Verrucomicrobiota bacterium]
MLTSGRSLDVVADVVRLKAEFEARTQPATSCDSRFPNGVRLHGLTFDTTRVEPGGSLRYRHFWSCPITVETEELVTFTHFESGENRFQDDHIFLLHNPQKNISFQPFKEIFTEERILNVPEDLPPGSYRIRMGLIVRATGDRLKPQSKHDVDDRAVTLPLTLEVVEKP